MPIVTTTRALTMVRVGAGESWSRRNSLLCRQPCSVAAAPKAALIATAQPSSPGVTNWITCSEESSTRSARKSNTGGRPEAATLAPSTNARSVPCVMAAWTWSVWV